MSVVYVGSTKRCPTLFIRPSFCLSVQYRSVQYGMMIVDFCALKRRKLLRPVILVRSDGRHSTSGGIWSLTYKFKEFLLCLPPANVDPSSN